MKNLLFIIPVLLLFGCSSWQSRSGTETPAVEEEINVEESNEAASESDPAEETGIKITAPQANSVVTFPLVITGEAKGTWYFEATFGVKLVDSAGTVLAQTYAQALDNWMQEGFVAFESTIEEADPNTDNGKLILEKANMSGLPENDFKVEVPVKFQ